MDDTTRKLLAECDVEAYCKGGPGGQHVNKVATAIRLTHRPTGIVVRATERRSQSQNKSKALKRLAAKLAELDAVKTERIATEPSKGAVERRLKAKRRNSDRKAARRPVKMED